jgi:hypothetical protein
VTKLPEYEGPAMVTIQSAQEELQLDLFCVVSRLSQLRDERGSVLAELLIDRLLSCDLPRLERHITPETATWAEPGFGLFAGPAHAEP